MGNKGGKESELWVVLCPSQREETFNLLLDLEAIPWHTLDKIPQPADKEESAQWDFGFSG